MDRGKLITRGLLAATLAIGGIIGINALRKNHASNMPEVVNTADVERINLTDNRIIFPDELADVRDPYSAEQVAEAFGVELNGDPNQELYRFTVESRNPQGTVRTTEHSVTFFNFQRASTLANIAESTGLKPEHEGSIRHQFGSAPATPATPAAPTEADKTLDVAELAAQISSLSPEDKAVLLEALAPTPAEAKPEAGKPGPKAENATGAPTLPREQGRDGP